jgi:hypothetical protein
MISEKLQNASDWTLSWAKRGEAMPPRDAAELAQRMMDIASQVRAMENVPLRLDAPEVRLGFHKLRRERHDAE